MTALWVLAYAVPAVLGLVLALTGAARGARGRVARARMVVLAAVATLPAAALTLLAPTGATLDLPWLLLGSTLQLDQVGRPLLLTASLLYAAAIVTVRATRLDRADALTAFLLVCFVGNALVLTAADVATFYLGFAVMSFAAYGLVLHERRPASERAGRTYLSFTVASELLVLAAVLLIAAEGGVSLSETPAVVAASDHRDLVVALLIGGFGIKAGTVPFHAWMPLTYASAPAATSAALSGAMSKAGLVGLLRFLPLGESPLETWGAVLVVLGLVGAIAALPFGAVARDPEVALAYSSVSQMGFLAVLVGTALADPEIAPACVLAAVVYAVHHGLAKGALFLGVALWRRHGDGPNRVVVAAGLAVAALAVAGAPLGSGAVAKYAAKEAVVTTSVLGVELVDLLPLVGTVSTLLLARSWWALRRESSGPRRPVDLGVVAWGVLVVAGVPLTWVVATSQAPPVSVPGLDPVTTWEALWPILLGLALAGAAVAVRRRAPVPTQAERRTARLLPAGDLLVPLEAVLARADGWRRRVVDDGGDVVSRVLAGWGGRVVAASGGVGRGLSRAEDRLEGWRVAGVAILVVGAVVAVAAWWGGAR